VFAYHLISPSIPFQLTLDPTKATEDPFSYVTLTTIYSRAMFRASISRQASIILTSYLQSEAMAGERCLIMWPS